MGNSDEKIVTTEVLNVTSAGAIDFDNDGDLDIVSASEEGIHWYENTDGVGTFGPAQEMETNVPHKDQIHIADMDNDGDLDIVNGSEDGPAVIAWFVNEGSTSDNFTTQINTTHSVTFAGIADINMDGYNDTYKSISSHIVWNENLGNGDFSDSQHIHYPSSSSFSQTIFHDMDNDGDVDIYFIRTTANPPRVSYFENDGTGSYGDEQFIFSSYAFDYTLHDVGDYDNDNDIDIILLKAGELYIIECLGTDDYEEPVLIENTDIFRFDDLKSIDIDNDGDLDLFTQSDTRSISLRKNTGAGLDFEDPAIIGAAPNFVRSAKASDIDGDGVLDVVTASYFDGKIAWHKTIQGDDYFSEQFVISEASDNARDIASADIDGDGDMDVVTISGADTTGSYDKLSWYENLDGQGTFGDRNDIFFESYKNPDGLLVFDIDGDGDIDVVTAKELGSGDAIYWYENLDGNGNFSSQQIVSTEVDRVSSLINADIDGDGFQDIVSTSFDDHKIAWYRNLENSGSFGDQQIVITDGNSSFISVYAADVDGDNDLDLVYADNVTTNSSVDKITWIENTDGLGTFDNPQIITETDSNGSTAVVATDIDNDGDIDVVATSRPSYMPGSHRDKLIWMENLDGLGDFSPQRIIFDKLDFPDKIVVADIDNDSRMDILSTSRRTSQVFWHQNLGVVLNEIKGTVYLDVNADDCATGTKLPNVLVTSEGPELISTTTLNGTFKGFYELFVGEGNFSTSVTSNFPDYFEVNPTSQDSNFGGVGNSETIDFCIEPTNTFSDLKISVYPLNDPRAGFDTSYNIVYRNMGTIPLNGNITFQFDDEKMQFLNASESVNSQTSNSLTFDYINLNPLDSKNIIVEFNIFPPPTTNIDDLLNTTAVANPIAGDNTEEDNTFVLEQTVIGSYDPNDILVLEGDEIFFEDIDKYLHYMIRFQNTGTASAINVLVEHVLDANLDWSTLEVEDLSHDGVVRIENGNEIEFIFDDINLPDSTSDEPNSHGFITFKIKPKNSLIIGDIILGVADIYFDFNPPIITNTVSTEVVGNPLSVDHIHKLDFALFPNPSSSEITIRGNNSIKQIRIFDVNGRLLTSIKENNVIQTNIDIADLTKGIYLLEITSENGKEIQKFIKN